MLTKIGAQLISGRLAGRWWASWRTLYSYHHRHMVIPPRTHIAYAEKVFWGLFLGTGMLFYPAWVLYHIDEYKGKPSRVAGRS